MINIRSQTYLLVTLKFIPDILELQMKNKKKGLKCVKFLFLRSLAGGGNAKIKFRKSCPMPLLNASL